MRRFSRRTALGAEWSGWVDLGWVDVRPQVTDISDGRWQCVSSDHLLERSHIHNGYIYFVIEMIGWVDLGV